MEVEITRTTPIYRSPESTGVFIQWVVKHPPVSGVGAARLERSGSPEGPFELVVDNINTYHYFDKFRDTPAPGLGLTRENLNFLSLAREVYYRLTVLGADGSSARVVREVGDELPKRQSLLKRKIQRDIRVGFKFNGVPIAVLKRKHWGIRCVDCFDLLTKRVTTSKCNTCFGTGFEGGYYEPVRISGRISVKNVQTDITVQGKADINQTQLTMLDFPILEDDDIVVHLNTNQRYIVKHVTRTELRTVPVHQKILLSELERSSVEYRLIVNKDHLPVIY